MTKNGNLLAILTQSPGVAAFLSGVIAFTTSVWNGVAFLFVYGVFTVCFSLATVIGYLANLASDQAISRSALISLNALTLLITVAGLVIHKSGLLADNYPLLFTLTAFLPGCLAAVANDFSTATGDKYPSHFHFHSHDKEKSGE